MNSRVLVQNNNHAYWLLALLWPPLVLPLTYLAVSILEGVSQDIRLTADHETLPLLTQWYQALGTPGLYLITTLPLLLFLILFPFRTRQFAIISLALALVISIYLTFGGIVAAHIAYVKLCV